MESTVQNPAIAIIIAPRVEAVYAGFNIPAKTGKARTIFNHEMRVPGCAILKNCCGVAIAPINQGTGKTSSGMNPYRPDFR